MKTVQTGAIVWALLAIANADSAYWQAAFTVAAAINLLVAQREERKAAS